jgi:hypothetical protein
MKPTSWLRRNRLALSIVVVLLPVTLVITFANQWFAYYAAWPSQPLDVAVGEVVDYGDADWRIEGSRRFTAASPEGQARRAPAGTDVVVVTVWIDPSRQADDEDARLCTARLEESGGTGPDRGWSNAAGGAVRLSGTAPELTSCNSEQSGPYTFDAEFIVPPDAGQGSSFTLGVAVTDQLPAYARFAID